MKRIMLILSLLTVATTYTYASGDRAEWWEVWKDDVGVGNQLYMPPSQRTNSSDGFFSSWFSSDTNESYVPPEVRIEKKINPHEERSGHPIPIDDGFLNLFAFILIYVWYKLNVRGFVSFDFFKMSKREAWSYISIMIVFLATLGPLAQMSEKHWDLNPLFWIWAGIIVSIHSIRYYVKNKDFVTHKIKYITRKGVNFKLIHKSGEISY